MISRLKCRQRGRPGPGIYGSARPTTRSSLLDKLAHKVAAREEGDGHLQERIEDGKRLCVEGDEQLFARIEAQALVL